GRPTPPPPAGAPARGLIASSPPMRAATIWSAGSVTSSTSSPYLSKRPCSLAAHTFATLMVGVFSPYFSATRGGAGWAAFVAAPPAAGACAPPAAGSAAPPPAPVLPPPPPAPPPRP